MDKENTQHKQQNTQSRSHCPRHAHSRAVTAFPLPCSSQPEPSMTAHGMEYPVLFGQVGSARPTVFPPGSW